MKRVFSQRCLIVVVDRVELANQNSVGLDVGPAVDLPANQSMMLRPNLALSKMVMLGVPESL